MGMSIKLSAVAGIQPRDRVCQDQISRSVVPGFLQPHELQHAMPPCPSPTPGVQYIFTN